MTAILLLAAGESRRMGRPKQLLDFGGKPLLRHSAEVALQTACGPVIVVLGARERELRGALEGLPIAIAVNERWQQGMGTSIQTGLRALDGLDEVTGAILALADQPFVTAEFLKQLAGSDKQIAAASYAGTVGVPVYFARKAFPLLRALKPDQGCKSVILAHSQDRVLIDCPEAEIDIDTPEEYEAALTSSNRR
jgi:molybdenum cofactor cytidylyltransferase